MTIPPGIRLDPKADRLEVFSEILPREDRSDKSLIRREIVFGEKGSTNHFGEEILRRDPFFPLADLIGDPPSFPKESLPLLRQETESFSLRSREPRSSRASLLSPSEEFDLPETGRVFGHFFASFPRASGPPSARTSGDAIGKRDEFSPDSRAPFFSSSSIFFFCFTYSSITWSGSTPDPMNP